MTRFVAPYAFAVVVLAASPALAQNIATGTTTIPAAGGPDGPPRPAAPARAAGDAINYDTTHLQKRIPAARPPGSIMLDGALDEAAWREAPMANGFIQNDPREGDPATYDTDVRVLSPEAALFFGVVS